jgi:hypothetical protein
MAGKPLSAGKTKTKTKSQRSADGTRKLAADHGRKKPKAGGEAQKKPARRAAPAAARAPANSARVE